ncbi:MAG: glycosyltransferase family 39 protein [Pseudomonadota bacterium]
MAAKSAEVGFFGRLAQSAMGGVVSWAGGAEEGGKPNPRGAWRRALLLLIIALALLAPGIASFGPTDRDESRFAQATKQMVTSGDYVDIRFQEEARHQKPVGVYWAQSIPVSLLGPERAEIWAYRLPSLLGAALAALLTAWAARPLVGPRAAFLAGAMTAGLVVLSFEARTGKADAMLLAAVVAAQGALARLWFGVNDDARERGWNIFYFWTAIGVGFLLKGPIILMPVLGTIAWMCAWSRSLSGLGRLGWAWGLVWLLLLVAPWYVAIGVQTGGAFFDAALAEDLLGKVAQSRERPGLPPGAHLLAFFGAFWPWTALALIAVPYVWRWRRAPETAFLLGWLIPTWIVFELVATKLVHYTLPVYPAILALTAAAVLDGGAKAKGWLFWIAATLWAIPALALPIAFWIGPSLIEGRLIWETTPLAVAALIALFAAWRWLTKGLWLGFVRAALVGAGLTYANAYAFAFPALSQIWVSERLVALSEPWRACAAGEGEPLAPLGAVRYHEPSLVFLAGTDTALLGPEEAGRWLASGAGALVWIEAQRDDRFRAALAAEGAAPRLLAETTGFQYNGGKSLTLRLYAREGDERLGARCPETAQQAAAAAG